jgi:hypothetical protein
MSLATYKTNTIKREELKEIIKFFLQTKYGNAPEDRIINMRIDLTTGDLDVISEVYSDELENAPVYKCNCGFCIADEFRQKLVLKCKYPGSDICQNGLCNCE